MKDDILTYINNTFTYELQEDIKRAITLFDLFEIEEYQDDLSNLLMAAGDVEPAQIQDSFLGIIRRTSDFILIDHTLALTECPLSMSNEVLSSLYILQDLFDYSEVKKYLEIDENVLTRISKILALYCSLSYADIMYIVKDYDSSLLDRIKELADINDNKIYNQDEILKIGTIFNLEKKLGTYTNVETLALRFMKKGFKANYDLKHYLPFIGDEVLATDSDNIDRGIDMLSSMVYNIISIAIFSSDGYDVFMLGSNEFLKFINEYLDLMVPNVTENLKNKLANSVSGFYEYLETTKEKPDGQI